MLVGAFSVIVQPVVEPMDRFTALIPDHPGRGAGGVQGGDRHRAAQRDRGAARHGPVRGLCFNQSCQRNFAIFTQYIVECALLKLRIESLAVGF